MSRIQREEEYRTGDFPPRLRYLGDNPTRERMVQRREDGELETETASLNSIEVTRYKDGSHGWVIKTYWHKDWRAVLQEQGEIDAELRSQFIGPPLGDMGERAKQEK